LCAVTLLELLVVAMIISILASIATGIYTGETQRARIASTRELIHSLEVAITRYEIDTGSLPPSGTGEPVPPDPLSSNSNSRSNGSGYLHLALMHSMSANAMYPASSTWKGPYINIQNDQMAVRSGFSSSNSAGVTDFIDSWGMPINYVAWPDYGFATGAFTGGTRMFTATAPTGANANLPAPNPFAASETYYNPRTFQLISYGPNAKTLDSISGGGLFTASYAGAEDDDINNFGY
jgi:prepilin-type N-terminal cleavage/methylation domain-containing protein